MLRHLSVFKNVRHSPKGFRYKSRFYDAQKEKREARYRETERDVAIELGQVPDDEITPTRAIRFDRRKSRTEHQRKSLVWSNIRLVIILVALVSGSVYTWYYFKSLYA